MAWTSTAARVSACAASVITHMDIKPKISTYMVAALGGYFLAFFFVAIGIAMFSVESLIPLIPIFIFSLIVAIPVTVISSVMGYPIFKLLFNKLQLPIFQKLVVSGGASCIACIIVYAIGFNVALGALSLPEAIVNMSGALLVLCVAVLPCSALVYWFVEK